MAPSAAAFETLRLAVNPVNPVSAESVGPWQTSSIWVQPATFHECRALPVRVFLVPRKLRFLLHSAFDAVVQRAGLVLRQIFRKDPAIAFSGCNEGNPPNAFGWRWAINSIWIGKIDVPLRDVTGLGIDHPSGRSPD
jgi:hypothetical protein